MEKNAKETALVFMHGAGLGSYIWDEVVRILPNQSLQIDYPNRGKSRANRHLTWQDYQAEVAREIRGWKSGPFVLVAHSIAACLSIPLLEIFASDVAGFVAIGACIPKRGQSFCDTLPFPQSHLLPLILNVFGTRPSNQMIKAQLCHDLNQKQTKSVIERFTPEARNLYTHKIEYRHLPEDSLYIKLLADKALAPSIQEQMIANLSGARMATLRTGHLPMLSKPQALADILLEYVATVS